VPDSGADDSRANVQTSLAAKNVGRQTGADRSDRVGRRRQRVLPGR